MMGGLDVPLWVVKHTWVVVPWLIHLHFSKCTCRSSHRAHCCQDGKERERGAVSLLPV